MLRIITSRNYNCEKVEGKGKEGGQRELRTSKEKFTWVGGGGWYGGDYREGLDLIEGF